MTESLAARARRACGVFADMVVREYGGTPTGKPCDGVGSGIKCEGCAAIERELEAIVREAAREALEYEDDPHAGALILAHFGLAPRGEGE